MSYVVTSHETFTHDSLDSLGYDWERIADPAIAPRYPLKVYLPQSTADVVAAVSEARGLGQRLTIRSKGHSSNDLVVADRGSVLCTEKLNHVLAVDEQRLTVTIESGVILAELDLLLAQRGLGLPIIGDHNHITAGGFASVGGISPASHRFGMFVDTVQVLEVVTWDGTLIRCSRTDHPDVFHGALAGTGQHGVIATLTCRVIPIDKDNTILRNHRSLTTDFATFVRESHRSILDPGEALMERGLWVDFPVLGTSLTLGQFSSYVADESPSLLSTLWDRVAYGWRGGLGYVAGRLPKTLDVLVHYLGILGIVFSPQHASVRNIEAFTDKVIDETVGDPTRMFIALAPVDAYPSILPALYELFGRYRTEHGCFTFLSFYVKAIRSPYLGGGGANDHFCEVMAFVGIAPELMTPAILESLVSDMDDLCIAQGALRYMHSRTVKDSERRRQIDPNARWAADGMAAARVPAA